MRVITRYGVAFILLFFLFVGCINDSQLKHYEISSKFGEIAKGEGLNDSSFHGLVKYYNFDNGNYLGYATFKCGYESGPCVRFRNNNAKDSFFYQTPIKNGYEYLLDMKGRLTYKAYLLDGRVVGPAYEYDAAGHIKQFYFYNFEGDVLYHSIFDKSGMYEKGSVINISVHDKTVNDVLKTILFMYIVNQPDGNSYYEIAVFDDKR